MGNTILVTGGSGFIGSYLLRLLAERGDTPVNLDIRPPRDEAEWWLKPVADRVQFKKGSVSRMADVIEVVKDCTPDTIIHIAATGVVDDGLNDPWGVLDVNVVGALNVLEATRLFEVRRLVNFSSIGVLPKVIYEPIDTNHPVMTATDGPGIGFYAPSKVAAEVFCWTYHQSYGVDFITIRPSAVYGFGMQVPMFIKPMVENAVQGLPTRFETGSSVPRDYTHVHDVTQLALAAVDIPADAVQDRVFYGATGRPLVTAGEAAEVVKALIPGADIHVGQDLSEYDKLDIRFRGIFDIENAQNQLNYRPHFADLRDGVSNYIEEYRKYIAHTSPRP